MITTSTHQTQIIVTRAARRMKLAACARGLCWWLALSLGVWLVLFQLDNALGLPAGLRLPLSVAAAVLMAIGCVRHVVRPALRRVRPECAALILEDTLRVPDNLLINAVQFEQRALSPAAQVFADRIIASGFSHARRVNLAGLWDSRRLLRWAFMAIALVVAWVIYCAASPGLARNAARRFINPLADIPPASAVTVSLTPSRDLTVFEGDALTVSLVASGKPEQIDRTALAPVLVWREDADTAPAITAGGEQAAFVPSPDVAGMFSYTFSNIRRPMAFRAFAAGTYTPNVRVRVQPQPRIAGAIFRVGLPTYARQPGASNDTVCPGPPAPVAVLPGSPLAVVAIIDPPVRSLSWIVFGTSSVCRLTTNGWEAATTVHRGGSYELEGVDAALLRTVSIARGSITLQADNPPELDFVTDDRNRLVPLGATINLAVKAQDDYGIRYLRVTIRRADQDTPPRELKAWPYIGPPGTRGPVNESCSFTLDPAVFEAGASYIVEAEAADFNPVGVPARSRPILIRIRSFADLTLDTADPLSAAFNLLKTTIAQQQTANRLTINLRTHLDEAIENRYLDSHRTALTAAQQKSMTHGTDALQSFRACPDGAAYAATLDPLVRGEMPWVLNTIRGIGNAQSTSAPSRVASVVARQDYILNGLISLLGRIADAHKASSASTPPAETTEPPTLADASADLKTDLQRFIREQEKVIDRSKTLMDKRPEDLTFDEQEILGALAREESVWSKFFEEKLTDYSKLPAQDFADGSLAKELNAVYQEVQLAAASMYAKATEIAVNAAEGAMENAKELEQNLEKWLPTKPDNLKWNMEEPLAPDDVAMAELPAELEDIVGELLDNEEAMAEDVEDVSSSWMGSFDKGAGWDAMDGPISSMSAKGVTGNLLPNQMEIGGRSGEGRTGRSSGQMVQDEAVGKGGRETPTRLSTTPFEQGSVKDSDTKSKGGATGGGKLSGFGAQGLRGPTAPPTSQKTAPRLAEQQATIRQQTERIALRLRQYKLPTGDLEASATAMKQVEDAAQIKDGVGIRRAYSRAIDTLADANRNVRTQAGLLRERMKLPAWMRAEITTGLQDGTPRGYEDQVANYFRALAEQEQQK